MIDDDECVLDLLIITCRRFGSKYYSLQVSVEGMGQEESTWLRVRGIPPPLGVGAVSWI